jgi:23S rRNA pseudouridine2605 synthase
MPSEKSPEKVRLNKLIAEAGLASRRGADEIIESGQVTVNGKKVYELGIKVDPNNDKVLVDGKPLRRITHKIYLLFNKPKGVLTTMEDPLDRPNVSQYLDKVPYRVFPVGRLDWDSEGMLLLTNDGDFANKVTNPKSEVTKTYLVKVDGQPTQEHLNKLLKGVSIVGGKVAAKHIERIKRKDASDKYDWFKMIITEGKNRQIRQMFEKIGFDVMKLQRVAIGRLRMGHLERGDLVYIDERALEMILLPDAPEELKEKRSYKGRQASTKRPPRPPTQQKRQSSTKRPPKKATGESRSKTR